MARSSEATKARRKAKKALNALKALETDTPRKPGNPGDFHGRRAEFINEFIEEFLGLRGKERHFHATFWAAFFAKYWAKFHWSIPLTEEVPLPDPEADATLRAPSPEFEDEDLIRMKGEIIQETQAVRSMRSMFCAEQYTDVAHTAAETALSISCDHDTSEAKSLGAPPEVTEGCCGPGSSASQAPRLPVLYAQVCEQGRCGIQ